MRDLNGWKRLLAIRQRFPPRGGRHRILAQCNIHSASGRFVNPAWHDSQSLSKQEHGREFMDVAFCERRTTTGRPSCCDTYSCHSHVQTTAADDRKASSTSLALANPYPGKPYRSPQVSSQPQSARHTNRRRLQRLRQPRAPSWAWNVLGRAKMSRKASAESATSFPRAFQSSQASKKHNASSPRHSAPPAAGSCLYWYVVAQWLAPFRTVGARRLAQRARLELAYTDIRCAAQRVTRLSLLRRAHSSPRGSLAQPRR